MIDLTERDATAALQRLLDEAVGSGLYSAMVGLVASVCDGGDGSDEILWTGGAGTLSGETVGTPPDRETVFDLASITKSFTGGLAVVLADKGILPWTITVGDVFPQATSDLAPVPLGDLLRQRAGFCPWTPFYAAATGRDEALALLLNGDLLGAEPETYSDLGFLLWGFAAEEVCGAPLAGLLAEHMLEPLGIAGIAPQPGPSTGVARCHADGAREAGLAADEGWSVMTPPAPELGQAQDGNARFFGGMCGHAGLFGSAHAVWTYARQWLTPNPVLPVEGIRGALAGDRSFLLGWTRPAAWPSVEPALPATAFGALGFTGGSLWIDPASSSVALLLGHRRSPLSNLGPLRREFHGVAGRLFKDRR